MTTADPRFERDLTALLEENDITPSLLDVLDRLASRPAYYEMPVYSRYGQLAFMAALGFTEVNRQLIRASVAFLERELARRLAAGDGRTRDYLLCMVHITGWDLDPGEEREFSGCNDGSLAYITPYIFVGDLRTGPMANFDVRKTGRAPAFQPPASSLQANRFRGRRPRPLGRLHHQPGPGTRRVARQQARMGTR